MKCLFWKSQDSNWLVKQYHRLLVWDLMENPALTRILEKSMNPIMGKSVVMYFRKEAHREWTVPEPGAVSRGISAPDRAVYSGLPAPVGEIPWFEGGYTDPWDHVESAMGLSIGGEFDAARRAYEWLAEMQLEDGSWWASYRGEEIDNPQRRESNFVAYIATGVWHHYLISQDGDFLAPCGPWSTRRSALSCHCSPSTGKLTGRWTLRVSPRGMPWSLAVARSSRAWSARTILR